MLADAASPEVAELRAEVEEVLQKRGEEVTQHIQQGGRAAMDISGAHVNTP